MAASLIKFVLSNFTAILFVLALLLGVLGKYRPASERYLNWLLLLPIGLGGLWAGIYHVFFPDVAAEYIGWAPSPFQFEVGMADLALGVTAICAFWCSLGFKAAAVIANGVFLFGDAVGHVHQMQVAQNYAAGNAGPVFYLDIILPVATAVLLYFAWRAKRHG